MESTEALVDVIELLSKKPGPRRKRPACTPRSACGFEPRVLFNGDTAIPLPNLIGPVEMLPDLFAIADQPRRFLHGWRLDSKELPDRTLLRFTTATANAGLGDLEIYGGTEYPDDSRDVFQRVYDGGGGFADHFMGRFSQTHRPGFLNVPNYAEYRLHEVGPGNSVGAAVSVNHKVSFCLVDSGGHGFGPGGTPRRFIDCQGEHGISPDWADIYRDTLTDQWVDITGLAAGDYWLEAEIDPANVFIESDDSNNITRIMVTLGDDHGNHASTATALPANSSAAGVIEAQGDNDMFRFHAEGQWTYRFTTELGSLFSSALVIYGPDGLTPVGLDSAAGDPGGSLLDWIAPADGHYFVDVNSSFLPLTGDYQLHSSIIAVPEPSTAAVLAVGSRVIWRGRRHRRPSMSTPGGPNGEFSS